MKRYTELVKIAPASLSLLLLAAVFFFIAWRSPSYAVVSPVDISLPPAIGQGEPFLLKFSSPQPLAGAEIHWLGRKIWAPAHKDKDHWFIMALLGADLDQETGDFPLEAKITTTLNEEIIIRNIKVLPKAYPKQRLRLPARMVKPSAEALLRIKQEEIEIREILSLNSPVQYWWPGFVRPVEGSLSSPFGVRRVLNGKLRAPHRGLDFKGAFGTPVRAWSAGIAALKADHYFGGLSLYLDHGLGVISSYLHLSEILVEPGQPVVAGQIIGRIGSSGRSTAPHLHFGLSVRGQWFDPLPLWNH